MSRLRGEPTELENLSEWQMVSHPQRDRRWEEVLAFRERLVASLRAGHGLGVAFDLLLVSGPVPQLSLGCSDPASARWVGRILFPAYGRASWVRRSASKPDPTADRRWGRRVRDWPDVLREPSDGPSAFDSLALAMSGVTPGVSVRWGFRPCPATWSRPRDLDGAERPRPPTEGRGSGDRLPRARRPEAPAPARPFPLFWKAKVCVALSRGEASDLVSAERVRPAIEVALRSGRANGVRFSRRPLRLPWGSSSFFLSEDELACVLPSIDCAVGPRERRGGEGLPILPLGRSPTGRVVGPPVEPDQGRHLAVLGETGMGKSSTLVAVARKAATLGGVVLFDPLGETARSFLSGLSAGECSRLVGVSPHGGASGINALEGIGGRETDPVLSDRRLNDLVHALRRVRSGRYVDSNYWGPRLEEMLTRAVSAAAAFPSGTLADAHTLLATGGRTRQVVPPEAQEAVRELSDRVRERPDDAEGARRLLYEVVRSPVLRRMLCERNPVLHARELVGTGRIAVISGDASEVGESVARYLLAVYLALVWSELLARPSNPKTFVVLDESQWFSHESLAEMLRLARRRNVHVVLATHTVGSLPEAVADAVWTNVSDFIAFRSSPEEARELSRATRGLSVEELLALPRGHAAVLLGKGSSVDWVRTAGRPMEVDPPSPDGWGTPPDPGPGPGDAAPREESVPATVEKVLAWILGRARALPAGEPLRVELAELRRTVDPEGRAIREAGARLGRAGALVSSAHSPGGSVWVLDPARIPAVTGETPPSPSSDASQRPQPS
ncbi:MAG TPA: DUF87 domain-containing protein [Thermoplasmata archaeon]